MISRTEEEAIRQIVREEIALDEMRRIQQIEEERPSPAPQPAVPGLLPVRPGSVFLGKGHP